MMRFKELLLDNQQVPMKDREQILEKTFLDWKGNLEHIDDVMVIGIQI